MSAPAVKWKALWQWLVGAKHLGLALVVIAVASIVSFRPQASEQSIRLTGLILQLLGLMAVIVGIHKTRELFRLPSFTSGAKDALRRFPLLRRNLVVEASGTILLASVGLKARGHVTHGASENPTTEARLAALEKNIDALHGRISETQSELDQGFTRADDALKREQQIRNEADAAIAARLEATGTGGVNISLLGTLCLFLGLILSTAAAEIVALSK